MTHTCHARRCDRACKPSHLMCGKHWRMVPEVLKRRVYMTYRTGQEDGSGPLPSEEWHEAADAAIEAVAKKEGLVG